MIRAKYAFLSVHIIGVGLASPLWGTLPNMTPWNSPGADSFSISYPTRRRQADARVHREFADAYTTAKAAEPVRNDACTRLSGHGFTDPWKKTVASSYSTDGSHTLGWSVRRLRQRLSVPTGMLT